MLEEDADGAERVDEWQGMARLSDQIAMEMWRDYQLYLDRCRA